MVCAWPSAECLASIAENSAWPTLYDMEAQLRKFSVPLLVIVGDEDEPCLEGSVFLKRIVPTAGLMVIPRSGHNIPSEEPAQFNAALAQMFAAIEAGGCL